jgi:hypothetical protein
MRLGFLAAVGWICGVGMTPARAEWGPEVPESERMIIDREIREEPMSAPGECFLPQGFEKAAAGLAETPAAQPSGALSGIVVYCSAGHGFGANSATTAWIPERPLLYALNEDMGNIDQLNYFAEQAWKAGATVVPFRPVGHQTNEVVLDNVDTNLTSSGQVSFGGSWANTTQTTLYYGAVGQVGYRYAAVNSTGTTAWAIYRPNLPAAGTYPVYTWVRSSSDRANQLYRVYHSGGVTDVRVDHSQVGLGWVWLGNFHFLAGTNGSVNISNHVPDGTGAVVIADAIRFGNGMGNVARGSAGISGFEQDLESSRFWTIKAMGVGFATTLYDLAGYDDREDNIGQPARMAANMCRTNGWPRWRRLYVGFHSNAGTGTSRGVWALGDSRLAAQPAFYAGQTNLGMSLARRVHTNMVAGVAAGAIPSWSSTFRSTTYDSTYGEIYNSSVYELMDTTILEVAFHDNADDAAVLKSPKGRQEIARAAVQGIVDHVSKFYADSTAPSAYVPDAPDAVHALNSGAGTITVSWTMPAANAASGDAPTGFMIYSSEDGMGFGNPVAVSGGAVRSRALTGLAAGATLFFRVCATNAGGESANSPVAGARVAVGGARADVLVVDGFKRNDSALAPTRYFANGLDGQVTVVRPRMINGFDYAKEHGRALAAASRTFDSLDAGSVTAATLTNYTKVVWMLGEESTADETFSSAEQTAVTAYLNAGGRLLVSGAEIGWDLDHLGSASDRQFMTNVLRAAYSSDSGGTGQVTGTGAGILNGLELSFNFTNLLTDLYAANYPDVLAAGHGARVAAVYGPSAAGSSGAIIQFSNATYRTVVMGFPFEAILAESNRTAVMSRVLDFFDAGAPEAPLVTITTLDQTVASGTASISISGTNNAAVVGTMSWTNGLGGSGSFAAAASWWVDVPLAAGTNIIRISGTNAVGAAASDSVQIIREFPTASLALLDEPFDASPVAPAGWTFSGIAENYATATNSGRATPSVKFDTDGDSIVSPTFSGGTNVQFWMRANPTAGTVATGTLVVAAQVGGNWITVSVFTNPVKTGIVYLSDLTTLARQIRFTWNKSYGNIALDDVIVNGMWSVAADSDRDGVDDFSEYVAGTSPGNPTSVLALASFAPVPTNADWLVFQWPSVAGRVYSLWRATNAISAYTQHVGQIAASAPTNTVTNAAPAAAGTYYYGIRVAWPAAP